MDVLMEKLTQQAMNYAIRSGITITSGYAIRQCGRLLKETPKSTHREELMKLQLRLESKIRIISPAIDMIDLIAARGNTSLESAVTLTKEIRWEIQALGTRLLNAANDEQLLRKGSSSAKSRTQNELELQLIITDIRRLLDRIEGAVPLINLAITTSGVNLSTNLPKSVSPSRLLQASAFLTAADSQYAAVPGHPVQVGPVYTLSMYMLFAGHARPHDEEGIRETTWKEVIHKARLKLVRVPLNGLYELPVSESSKQTNEPNNSPNGYFAPHMPGESKAYEFAYQLYFIEDLEDDRFHTFEGEDDKPEKFDDVNLAGIRDIVPIHEISKIFYADTGKILNIGTEGEVNSPILLLKRDVNAHPPRRMMAQVEHEPGLTEDDSEVIVSRERKVSEQDEVDQQLRRESPDRSEDAKAASTLRTQQWRLPKDLDPEWIAVEVYNEEEDSDSEVEEPANNSRPVSGRGSSIDPSMTATMSRLDLDKSSEHLTPMNGLQSTVTPAISSQLLPLTARNSVKTSLSLLEMLIRLTSLQQFRQDSHLAIDDELLNFFLEDSSTTGAGPDAEQRQRTRLYARQRVGFDPYDESPIKRRTEDYIQRTYQDGLDVSSEDWHRGNQDGRGWSEPPAGGRSPSYFNSPGDTPNSGSQLRSNPFPSSRRSTPFTRTQSSPMPQFENSPMSPMAHKSRTNILRAQYNGVDPKLRSPLGRGPSDDNDSALGTSPSAE